MRMALARTARLARDWRGRPATFPRSHVPAVTVRTVPSSRERSIEDWARYGGGLSAPDHPDHLVPGGLVPGSEGTRYSEHVVQPSA